MPNKPAQESDPFKKIKSGSWTKYGGGRLGLIHGQPRTTWHCQACGDEQPTGLPGFMLALIPGEYVKVCSNCFSKARRVEYSLTRVIKIVRLDNRS